MRLQAEISVIKASLISDSGVQASVAIAEKQKGSHAFSARLDV